MCPEIRTDPLYAPTRHFLPTSGTRSGLQSPSDTRGHASISARLCGLVLLQLMVCFIIDGMQSLLAKADPMRRRIVELLDVCERAAGEFEDRLDKTREAWSRRLDALERELCVAARYRKHLMAVAALSAFSVPLEILGSPISSSDLASAKSTIQAVNSDWIIAVKDRDAERIASPYALDAVNIGLDGRVLLGRSAIREAKSEWLRTAPILLDGSLQDDGMSIEGELIYEWGHSSLRWRNSDGTVKSTSIRFLTVWRKDPDLKWRIIRNLNFP
jgi:uncharacterized protein (TIGR02246 family)